MEEENLEQKRLIELFAHYGVIPVIAIESSETVIPLADALIEGGLPIAEITFRTAAAAEAIRTVKEKRPQLLVGAGTILSAEDLLKAKESGAEFGVAPGLNPEIVRKAQEIAFPFFPGVVTPSEVEEGLGFEIRVLKFFPAEAVGGVKTLKAIAAPYAHLGVRFIPTGGINMSNLGDYLRLGEVLAVGGTWIAKKEMISSAQWGLIRENASEASRLAAKIRTAP